MIEVESEARETLALTVALLTRAAERAIAYCEQTDPDVDWRVHTRAKHLVEATTGALWRAKNALEFET